MTIPISVFLALVNGDLEDGKTSTSVYPTLDRYRQIKAAVETLSRDRPDDYTEDEAGDGGRYYALTGDDKALAYWVEGFSRVLAIEYPAEAVSEDHEPQMLEPEDWDDDYWVSGVRYLRLPNHAPAATETMRVRFTAPYTWTQGAVTTAIDQDGHGFEAGDYVYLDGSTWYEAADASVATHIISAVADSDNATAAELACNIDPNDLTAVCKLAAAYCCYAIAAGYSNTTDSTIALDSVGHTTRAQEFERRGKTYEKLYRTHMGLDAEKQARPAGVFADWDTAPGFPPSRRYLYHGGR